MDGAIFGMGSQNLAPGMLNSFNRLTYRPHGEKEKNKMIEMLEHIKGIIKDNISIQIQSTESYLKNDGEWTVALVTERNEFPYWLHWQGNNIETLLCNVSAYLNGYQKQPHGQEEILGSKWLK